MGHSYHSVLARYDWKMLIAVLDKDCCCFFEVYLLNVSSNFLEAKISD